MEDEEGGGVEQVQRHRHPPMQPPGQLLGETSQVLHQAQLLTHLTSYLLHHAPVLRFQLQPACRKVGVRVRAGAGLGSGDGVWFRDGVRVRAG